MVILLSLFLLSFSILAQKPVEWISTSQSFHWQIQKGLVTEFVFKELFAPGVGANLTICRMPVAANDFSPDWYSYDETEGDFEMKNFSIENDLQTLVPFIKNAREYYP